MPPPTPRTPTSPTSPTAAKARPVSMVLPSSKSSARSTTTGPKRAHTPSSSISGLASLNGSANSELAKLGKEQLLELVRVEREEREKERERFELLQETLNTTRQTASEAAQRNVELEKEVELANSKAQELYVQGIRIEEELSQNTETASEVAEHLRGQIRELERKNREVEKRYKDQTESFDAERQSWHDQEQHLKLRISSLASSAAAHHKGSRQPSPSPSRAPTEDAGDDDPSAPPPDTFEGLEIPAVGMRSRKVSVITKSSEMEKKLAAELGSVQAQLKSLTASYESIERSHRTAMDELTEVKRANAELMETNESFEVLLGERTLGRLVGGGVGPENVGDILGEVLKLGEVGRRPDFILEEEELFDEENEDEEDEFEKMLLQSSGTGKVDEGAVLAMAGGGGEKEGFAKEVKKKKSRRTINGSAIGGLGGMDLEAELERANEADSKEAQEITKQAYEKLNEEFKLLKDANKALSLYISTIIDRIISMEGFEKVLAKDYNPETAKAPSTPRIAKPTHRVTQSTGTSLKSILWNRSSSKDESGSNSVSFATPENANRDRQSLRPEGGKRRSLSIDWNFKNPFSFSKTNPPLSPTAASSAQFKSFSASQLNGQGLSKIPAVDTEEDEEDRQERERLRADLALHGIKSPSLERRYEMEEKVKETEKREIEQKKEMEQGRASGFTEPKKLSLGRRPSSKRSSNSSRRSTGGFGGLEGEPIEEELDAGNAKERNDMI
ncbi:hypothetical protein BT69DRAFT_1291850 [Atractiella rhizophila]|nr:hypothetical protein BT69DRAFT_1291850 [Atractiella rhizophila]